MYFLYGFIACVLILIGHAMGKVEGEKAGRKKGFQDGVQAALYEVDKHLKSELQTPIDPHLIHRLMNERFNQN